MAPEVQNSLGQLLNVLLGLASTILSIIGVQVIQWLQSKKKEVKQSVGESNFWLLEQAAKSVVVGIEQLAKSAPGQEKIQMALENLAEIARLHKIDVSADLLRTLAEAAVKDMNDRADREAAKANILATAEPLKAWPGFTGPTGTFISSTTPPTE